MPKITVSVTEREKPLEPLADLTKMKLTKVKMNHDVVGAPMRHYGIARDFFYKQGSDQVLHPDLADAWIDCGHCDPIREVIVVTK